MQKYVCRLRGHKINPKTEHIFMGLTEHIFMGLKMSNKKQNWILISHSIQKFYPYLNAQT